MNGNGGLPPGEQLTLGERIQGAYRTEAARFRLELRKALTSEGRTLAQAAAELGIDVSHLTRMLEGRSHPAADLVVHALWRDRTGDFARYLCGLAGGEFRPRPPPGPEHWLPLIREDLARRGLWDLVADSVGYPRRPDPMPGEEP